MKNGFFSLQIALVMVLLLGGESQAQTLTFYRVQTAGGTSNDGNRGVDVAVDEAGNTYLTGTFKDTANFGGQVLTSYGNQDVFIAKYDSSGALLWARQAGSTAQDDGYSIAVDASGNSYITGNYSWGTIANATFGPISLINTTGQRVFVAKYDPSGNVLWVKDAGGGTYNYSEGIGVDAAGNSYISGWFWNTLDFGSDSVTSSGYSDIFIAKYDPQGNLVWAKQAGGNYSDESYSLEVDAAGNSYLTGSFSLNGPFQWQASFDTITLMSNGKADGFLAKYDESGNALWAVNIGGSFDDYVNGIAIDGAGNSYVTGSFGNSIVFANTPYVSHGGNDVFIAKFDQAGNALWGSTGGGFDTDVGRDIAVDGAGNCYVTGFAGPTNVTFENVPLTGFGNFDAFVVKYNTSGTLMGLTGAGGSLGDYGTGIAVSSTDACYVTGVYQLTATFNPLSLTSSGSTDIFLARIGGAFSSAALYLQSLNAISLSPNPAHAQVRLSNLSHPNRCTLYNLLGQQVLTQALPVSAREAALPLHGLAPGLYTLQVLSEEGVKSEKLVVE